MGDILLMYVTLTLFRMTWKSQCVLVTITHKRLCVCLLLTSILVRSSDTSQGCLSTACHFCTAYESKCFAVTEHEVIPQTLNQSVRVLRISFRATTNATGPVGLDKSMFLRYGGIEMLSLYGDFSSIAFDSFEPLSKLRSFKLMRSKITNLPNSLFAKNYALRSVYMLGNNLLEIPINAFGSNTGSLKNLHVTGNKGHVRLPCGESGLQLPKRLKLFQKLNSLDFTDTHFYGDMCQTIGDDIFDVGLRISVLRVGGTNLFSGSQSLLKPLRRLRVLQLNSLSPYKDCPSKVETLLTNLPLGLRSLQINFWESNKKLNSSCLFNHHTLSGLAKHRQLSLLSLSLNYKAFGAELKAETIPALPSLSVLNLDFCHLYTIDPGALQKHRNLSKLSLNGNPVGSKDQQVLEQPLTSLRSLNMQSSSLRSGEHYTYHAAGIMCSYPQLETLDLSKNFLNNMPIFQIGDNCNKTSLASMKGLYVNSNQLKYFHTRFDNRFYNPCRAFPNLKTLSLRKNVLRYVDGLDACVSVEVLHLSYNNIGFGSSYDNSAFERLLSKLTRLSVLDLSNNNLNRVHFGLLAGLSNLKRFYFAANNLQSLDEKFFVSNCKLETIDLSWNFIKAVTPQTFSHLANLTTLHLNGNLITSFSKDFLLLMENKPALKNLYIGSNPYDCDCGYSYFQEWANRTTKIYREDQRLLSCGSPPDLKDQSIYTYVDDVFKCYYKTVIIVAFSVLGGFIVTLVIALPCYKYRWYIAHIRVVWNAFMETLETTKLEHICEYDAYVSYDTASNDDQEWVVCELLKNVEELPIEAERGKLYVEGRDAPGGQSRMSEREVALRKSRKILIVASKTYIKSASCLGEADIAGYQMHGLDYYQPNRVMVLMRDELNEEEIIKPPMSSLLLGNVLQVETSERKKKTMWKKIRRFLAKPQYIYQKRPRLSSTSSVSSRYTTNSNESGISSDSDMEMLLLE